MVDNFKTVPMWTFPTNQESLPSATDFNLKTNINLVYFLKYAFDTSYVLLLCPFRLALDTCEKTGKITVVARSRWFQKILCFVFTILGFVWIISDLRTSLPTNVKNPTLYFRMLLKVDVSISKFIFLAMFWFSKNEIVQLLQLIIDSNSALLPKLKQSIKFYDQPKNLGSFDVICAEKVVAVFVCLLYTASALAEVITGHYTGSNLGGVKKSQWDISRYWRAMSSAGYHNFFIDGGSSNQTVSEIQELSHGDHFVAAISVAGFFQRLIN